MIFKVILDSLSIHSFTVDKTLESYAGGEEVVDAVINKIRHSNIFLENDHDFLKRLAFFRTKFGVESMDKDSFQGGIWQINETAYDGTKEGSLAVIHKQIFLKFKITWSDTAWTDLAKPMYSGLAARIILHVICSSGKNPPPMPQTLQEQANFWVRHLVTGPSVSISYQSDPTVFVSAVEVWEGDVKSCAGKMDFVVVLDGSASVGPHEFQKCKQFVWELFSSFSFDTVRMGFIVFSGSAVTVLTFSTTSRAEIQRLVLGAEYPQNMTNTNAGISHGLRLFQEAPLRPGVPKIMAVFTDGVSNIGGESGRGGVPDIKLAQEANVICFAVGIGHYINRDELLEIAYKRPLHVFQLTRFDALLEFFRRFNLITCAVPQTPALEERTSDTLAGNETRLYAFPLPPEGLLVSVDINQGLALGYYSYDFENPSPALNDGVLNSGSNFIPPRRTPKTLRQKRDLNESTFVVGTDSQVFVSIFGKETTNKYSIEALNGDGFVLNHSKSVAPGSAVLLMLKLSAFLASKLAYCILKRTLLIKFLRVWVKDQSFCYYSRKTRLA
ncbi:unnamed protein product [Allacma fusca]|uniref:VWFA domain-containing protein n=1 Tax=Allacma fusca TaxID=39272 RepID=A0A8J2LPQ1_9HEXA|nr:unnamed protein product [Allacma fusca]